MSGGIVNTYYTNIFRFVNPKAEITSLKLTDVASLVKSQRWAGIGGHGVAVYMYNTPKYLLVKILDTTDPI